MIHFKPLTKHDEWSWILERAHPICCEDSQGIVAYDDNGDIQAVCVFDSFTTESCSVHFAIGNPFVIKHGFFTEVANHAFHTLGKKRMFGLVPSDNPKALKLDLHIGFHEVARIPDAIRDGVDYIVIRLDKKDCRWLSEELREVA